MKTAQKQFKASKVEEAKATLVNKALLEGATDAKIKTQYFLLGQIARLDKDFNLLIITLKWRREQLSQAALATEMQQLTSDIRMQPSNSRKQRIYSFFEQLVLGLPNGY